MKKILLFASLIALTGCAEQAKVEKWECSSKTTFVDFIVDYENKTVGFGNPITGGYPVITELTVNGNVLRFEYFGGLKVTVGKTSVTSGNFYFRQNVGEMSEGFCKRIESW